MTSRFGDPTENLSDLMESYESYVIDYIRLPHFPKIALTFEKAGLIVKVV